MMNIIVEQTAHQSITAFHIRIIVDTLGWR